MGYEDLVTRLRGYNPPDRTIDQQRQMAQDFADAALSIEQLQARVAELEAEQLTWLASDDLIAQRAERAEAELATARATIDTMQGGYDRAAAMIIDLRQDLAAARALLGEVREWIPYYRWIPDLRERVDAIIGKKTP